MFRLIAREIKGAWQQISPVHVSKFPAYLGHTVYQSEYDALKAECDRAHKLNESLQVSLTLEKEITDKQKETIDDLRARIAKRDELITKLANDLQDANDTIEQERRSSFLLRQQALEDKDTIEKMSIEIDTLQKRLARRKQSPRETGVK